MIGKYMPLKETGSVPGIRASRMGRVYELNPVFQTTGISEKDRVMSQQTHRLANALHYTPGEGLLRPQEAFVFNGTCYLALGPIPKEAKRFLSCWADPPGRQLARVAQLARILCRLHQQGVLHMGLWEGSLLLAEEGLLLGDFSHSMLEGEAPFQSSIPNPGYLAPEALERERGKDCPPSPKEDCFALGLLMHDALTGELPPEGNAKQIRAASDVLRGKAFRPSSALPPRTRGLIQAMLSCFPENRPGDGEILSELRVCENELTSIRQ